MFNRGMDKEEAVCIYSGVLVSHKKKNVIVPFAQI